MPPRANELGRSKFDWPTTPDIATQTMKIAVPRPTKRNTRRRGTKERAAASRAMNAIGAIKRPAVTLRERMPSNTRT